MTQKERRLQILRHSFATILRLEESNGLTDTQLDILFKEILGDLKNVEKYDVRVAQNYGQVVYGPSPTRNDKYEKYMYGTSSKKR